MSEPGTRNDRLASVLADAALYGPASVSEADRARVARSLTAVAAALRVLIHAGVVRPDQTAEELAALTRPR